VSIRIAILLSGKHSRGSNMSEIARACRDGRVEGEIALVLGNHADSPAIAHAETLGLPTCVIPSPRLNAPDDENARYAQELRAALDDAAPDLICLAGYLRKLPSEIVLAWSGRIMNTHPALLPAFGGQGMYGARVHQAVLDYGVKISGCTVHLVDESYDTGPIILQLPVPVLDDDTPEILAQRVLAAEHEAYPRAVALFAAGRLKQAGRRVFVYETRQNL
jgi:phosphoribosylglycinamide formyltransferase-1